MPNTFKKKKRKKTPLYKGKHQPLTFQLRGCRRKPLLDPMALNHASIEDQTKQNLSNFNEKNESSRPIT